MRNVIESDTTYSLIEWSLIIERSTRKHFERQQENGFLKQ
jgi:hypothetical protein